MLLLPITSVQHWLQRSRTLESEPSCNSNPTLRRISLAWWDVTEAAKPHQYLWKSFLSYDTVSGQRKEDNRKMRRNWQWSNMSNIQQGVSHVRGELVAVLVLLVLIQVFGSTFYITEHFLSVSWGTINTSHLSGVFIFIFTTDSFWKSKLLNELISAIINYYIPPIAFNYIWFYFCHDASLIIAVAVVT